MTFGLGRLGASYGRLGAGNSSGPSTPGVPGTAPVLRFNLNTNSQLVAVLEDF